MDKGLQLADIAHMDNRTRRQPCFFRGGGQRFFGLTLFLAQLFLWGGKDVLCSFPHAFEAFSWFSGWFLHFFSFFGDTSFSRARQERRPEAVVMLFL
jgi:hypothetical protein